MILFMEHFDKLIKQNKFDINNVLNTNNELIILLNYFFHRDKSKILDYIKKTKNYELYKYVYNFNLMHENYEHFKIHNIFEVKLIKKYKSNKTYYSLINYYCHKKINKYK